MTHFSFSFWTWIWLLWVCLYILTKWDSWNKSWWSFKERKFSFWVTFLGGLSFVGLSFSLWFFFCSLFCIVWIPGSIPSLAAGLTFGGISAAAAHQTSAHPRNLWVMLGRSLWLLQINEKIGRKMHKFLWFIFECVTLADYVHCLNKGSDNVALFQALILKN